MLSIPFQATMRVIRSTGAGYASNTRCSLTHSNRASPFGLSNEQSLRTTFQRAGFKEVRVECMPLIIKLNSANEFAEETLELSAPLNRMSMKMNSDVERLITMSKETHAIAEAAAIHAGNNSNIVLENEALLAVGVKQ